MATAANGDQKIVFTSEANACDDIGSSSTPGDDRWSPINHRVRNLAGLVIARLLGAQHRSSNRLPQVFYGMVSHRFASKLSIRLRNAENSAPRRLREATDFWIKS